jgi:hypothetical protein
LFFWLKALFGVNSEGVLYVQDKEYYVSGEEYSLIVKSNQPVCFLESVRNPDKQRFFSQERLGMVVVTQSSTWELI